MNIQHFWPKREAEYLPTRLELESMFQARFDTFSGFAAVEKRRAGMVDPIAPLSSPQGQDMYRLFSFRVLEEICESMSANDEAHRKEELIDAVNYLWSLLFIGGYRVSVIDKVITDLTQRLNSGWSTYSNREADGDFLARAASIVAGDISDYLRNRSWMNNTQDPYFAGLAKLIDNTAGLTLQIITLHFGSFDEFSRYYWAKDAVLQFRLKSNY